MGVMGNALVGLAATCRLDNGKPDARFHILDGTRPDSPESGFWQRVLGKLNLHAARAESKDVGDTVNEVVTEVRRRMEAGDETASPIFLFAYNLSPLPRSAPRGGRLRVLQPRRR